VFPRGLTIIFLKDFALGLWVMFPLVFSLLGAIMVLGYTVGRRHGWSLLDSIYWSFMTATTVGYGDLRPTDRRSKLVAVLIAFLGLILTGIVIAVAVQATNRALMEVRR
jgi:voltage-gated potassium channel